MDSLSPFDQFRARSLLTWPLLVFLFVGLLTAHLIRLTGAHRVGNIIILEFEATCVIWALQQCRRHRISILRIFGPVLRNPRTWTYIALALALGVLSGGTVWLRVQLRYFLLARFGHTSFADWLVYRPQFVTNFDVWNIASLVQDVTLVPVIEELLFRGLLFHRWARKWGMTRGLLVSSFAFAVMHKDLLGTFVFGLVMALLYMRTHSLMIPIACHALDNALVFGNQAIAGISAWWNPSLCLPIALPILMLFLCSHWPGPNSYLPYSLPEQNTKQADGINRV